MATINLDKRLSAFLDLIAFSEGTSSSPITCADGYDIIVSGVDGANYFTDYSHHPFALGRKPIIVRLAQAAEYTYQEGNLTLNLAPTKPAVPALTSTASGRYQIILPTWKYIAEKINLSTFSPAKQDIAAIELMREKNIDNLIFNGDFDRAIANAAEIWASFPGNLYNQGGHTLDALIEQYGHCLAALNV